MCNMYEFHKKNWLLSANINMKQAKSPLQIATFMVYNQVYIY